MFQHLDAIIAFAMIMLLLSLLITTVVQTAVSTLGLRGRNLVWGVRTLLGEVAPYATKEEIESLTRDILTYPVISTSTNRMAPMLDGIRKLFGGRPSLTGGKRPPTAIRPKEVLLILGRLRRDAPEGSTRKSTLDQLFATLDTDAPATWWSARVRPKVEHDVEAWFDVVMDATAERFKLHTRWITVAGAAVLAFGFQIDSGEIFQRLSTDDELRASLVAQVVDVDSLYAQVYARQAADTPTTPGEPALEAAGESDPARQGIERTRTALDSVVAELTATPAVDLRWRGWASPLDNLAGKLATTLLLSLGAPFWYGALRNLVGFRSAVAKRREREAA